MTDVLLTHSNHLFYDSKQVRKMQPYPPLGTLYAAALLRQNGLSVALFDTMLEAPDTGFPTALARHRPKVVAVYEDNFNFLSKMCLTRMREVAFEIARAAKGVGATVVANGSDASDHVGDYLEHGFDFVLSGEAEWTLLELVRSLVGERPQQPGTIRGLAYLDGAKRKPVSTPARPLMDNLDALPFPARDLLSLEPYRRAWKSVHGFFSLNVVASRGCPYRCNWCAKPIYGNSFHVRAAECVAAEMLELKQTYGAEHLWFADDIFALKPRWALELADAVEKRDAAVPFKMQSRVNLMTSQTVPALKRAACVEVWMGVESGSQEVLDAMDKGTRVDEILKARDVLGRNGIRACFFLQFGYPGETWEDIQKTVELVRRTRPDDIGVSVSYPLPGTTFYDRVREQLGAKTNWEDSDDLAVMFKAAYTDELYRALRDALHAEVASWVGAVGPAPTPRSEESPGVKGGAAALSELWAKVERLEKTCRNRRPTLIPALACSDAGL